LSATSDPIIDPTDQAEPPTDTTDPTDTTAALGALRVALRRRRRFVTVTPEGSRIIRL